jgi:hypothetical protein
VGARGANVPMFALPKKRPALVDEDGGGGFWICDAVGARDWRMEYVLEGMAVSARADSSGPSAHSPVHVCGWKRQLLSDIERVECAKVVVWG